jgi:hypothetical protein
MDQPQLEERRPQGRSCETLSLAPLRPRGAPAASRLSPFTAGSCTLTLQLVFLRPHAGKRHLELLSQHLQYLYRVTAYAPLAKRVLAEETRFWLIRHGLVPKGHAFGGILWYPKIQVL